MLTLSSEQYKETLGQCKDWIEKYYKYGIDVDESLYLLSSKQDIENLATMIILNSKKTSELKQKVILYQNFMLQKCYFTEREQNTKLALEIFNSLRGHTSQYFENKISNYVNN